MLSVFQIEHSILRAHGAKALKGHTSSLGWTSWISELARFNKSDNRRFLSPRQPPPRELTFALFVATKSSLPLTVFRASTKSGLEAELRAHAARALARDVSVSGCQSIRSDKKITSSNDCAEQIVPSQLPGFLHESVNDCSSANVQSSELGEKVTKDISEPQLSRSTPRTVVVTLPAVLRYYAREWGRTNMEVVDAVHRLLDREFGDERLAGVLAMAHDDVVAKTHPQAWARKPNLTLKLEFLTYDWSPHISIC